MNCFYWVCLFDGFSRWNANKLKHSQPRLVWWNPWSTLLYDILWPMSIEILNIHLKSLLLGGYCWLSIILSTYLLCLHMFFEFWIDSFSFRTFNKQLKFFNFHWIFYQFLRLILTVSVSIFLFDITLYRFCYWITSLHTHLPVFSPFYCKNSNWDSRFLKLSSLHRFWKTIKPTWDKNNN